MAKIFPNLKKTITHRSKKLKLIVHKNMKKTTPGHSIIKSLKSSHNRKKSKKEPGVSGGGQKNMLHREEQRSE